MKLSAIYLMIAFFAAPAWAQEKTPPGKTYILVLSGVNHDPNDVALKGASLNLLRQTFVSKFAYPAAHVTILADKSSRLSWPENPATAANLKQTLQSLAGRIKPEDRFIFYYLGQANLVLESLRLNLPGPDPNHLELAAWLRPIPAKNQAIILDCPCAGAAIESLPAPGRIIISACRADQPLSPKFSEFFLPALSDKAADYDKNGRISLLEAFQATAAKLDEFYREEKLLQTEIPVLEDDGDGTPSQQPWDWATEKKDGEAAAKWFF